MFVGSIGAITFEFPDEGDGVLMVMARLLLVKSTSNTLYVPAGTVRSWNPLNVSVKSPVVWMLDETF